MTTKYVNEEKRKAKVLERFNKAHEIAGRQWMNLVISVDGAYDTKAGADVMKRISADRKRGTRIAYRKLLEVTELLERAVGISQESVSI